RAGPTEPTSSPAREPESTTRRSTQFHTLHADARIRNEEGGTRGRELHPLRGGGTTGAIDALRVAGQLEGQARTRCRQPLPLHRGHQTYLPAERGRGNLPRCRAL